jgi:UDP-GlcNAc:undecaprenyl-phosphate/decaprenyl-phosphate GlcNAc-1-phosphate transferase
MMQTLAFVSALLTSAIFTRWVRDIAIRRGWYSVPTSDRHIHTRPTPRLGGVAIFLTLCSMVLLAHWVPGQFSPHLTLKILGPATIIFLLGLVDDFRGLNAYWKFSVQAIAAALLFANGLGISRLSILAHHPHLGWVIGLPLTILWVLWITNAFNLIDGLDGLAAGSALFSTLVTFVMALLFHNEGISFLTAVLMGAIAGFLRYNFNPASIFLGDCGSLLIGFLLSALALAGSQKAPTVVAVAIPIVSLGLPILDVSVAVLRRFLSRKRLFDADREHIHHKLLGHGISHRQAVLVLYGVSACFGLLSLFLLYPASTTVFGVSMVVGIGVLVGVKQLRYHEFLEVGRLANRTFSQRQVIANDVNIRRATEALRSCSSLPEFCQILEDCLKPAGIDGFGISFSSELPDERKVYPFTHLGGSKLHFFWDRSMTSSETNWSLSFGLRKRDGDRLGAFTLYRKDSSAPLWLDVEVFTAAGFCNAVARVIEKTQDSWFAGSRAKVPEMSTVKTTTVITGVKQPFAIPNVT